ncbi:MAG: hypothetical protein SNJ53_06195, partial [Thermodesulfovibrionales bacterium]
MHWTQGYGHLMIDYSYPSPDPARADSNIKTFLDANPTYEREVRFYGHAIYQLFSYSQFLANFSTLYPERLFDVLVKMHDPINKDDIRSEVRDLLKDGENIEKAIRIYKKTKLMHITLRDILNLQDTQSTLNEISVLAEVLISEVFEYVFLRYKERYGL